MKQSFYRRHSLYALALAFLTAVVITGGRLVTNGAQDPTEQVRAVLMQNAAAFERGDMAALEKAWANDESVTVFESGHANYGWADYRDHHLGPEMKEMKNAKYTLSDIKIKVSSDTA